MVWEYLKYSFVFIENGVIICNKNETHKPLIELLYESKKRTGGDDIKELHFDKCLNQYVCIYYKPEVRQNVLRRGTVTFHQTAYVPMEIDRTKIILENIDEMLEMDTVSLYAEYLCQDVIRTPPMPSPQQQHRQPNALRVERLNAGFVLIDLDSYYGCTYFPTHIYIYIPILYAINSTPPIRYRTSHDETSRTKYSPK